ncbi:MAG: Holliday junction resolvase RuvX [Parachlamydiaceae bacterium]|nr:Holliday junction resolvase RuvX [Parachlamydiaceae bacterium]
MILSSPKKKSKRILGVDFGLKRFGIALSDESQIIATPLQTFLAEKKIDITIKNFLTLIAQLESNYLCQIEEIVIGLPLKMSGQMSLMGDEVNFFIQLLAQQTTIPIKKWDERLTTVQAERSLHLAGLNRKDRTKVVDKVSAAITLQSYLDFKRLTMQDQI